MDGKEEGEIVIDYVKDGHSIRVFKVNDTVTAKAGEDEIASSSDAMILYEDGYKPVYYFPLMDVNTELLNPTTKSSVCRYKGTANYFDINLGGKKLENSVWQYMDSHEDFKEIQNYVAFYDTAVKVEKE